MTQRPKPRLVKSDGGSGRKPDGRKPGDKQPVTTVSHGQRALWTFLMFTLVGPFVAALLVFLLTVGAGLMQAGPTSLKGLPFPELAAKAAGWSISSFVWSAVPAALAGAALAAWVSLKGGFPWLAAAVAGGIAASVAAFITGGTAQQHISFITVLAALSALACWAALRRARIIV